MRFFDNSFIFRTFTYMNWYQSKSFVGKLKYTSTVSESDDFVVGNITDESITNVVIIYMIKAK